MAIDLAPNDPQSKPPKEVQISSDVPDLTDFHGRPWSVLNRLLGYDTLARKGLPRLNELLNASRALPVIGTL